jgi:nucleotide-binding universal stress UspA family protein
MLDRGPILVPLDGSELAEKALPYARALADALRTHLVLITVWEGTDSEIGVTFPAIAQEIGQTAQQHFEEYLGGIRSRLGGGDEIRTIVRPGEAGEEILKAADETGARAIAIATHGRSGISRWLYGSTASHLLRHAEVPVLAVGPHALERSSDNIALKHVAVPLDGSEMSEAAIAPAVTLAVALKAKVSLVRAVNWAVQSYPYSLPDAYIPQVDEELESGAKAYLRAQEDAVRGKAEVGAFVVRGAIAEGLLDFVEKESADIVVMTTHARRGLLRATLGSVADRMLQGQAPVLLIRPEK